MDWKYGFLFKDITLLGQFNVYLRETNVIIQKWIDINDYSICRMIDMISKFWIDYDFGLDFWHFCGECFGSSRSNPSRLTQTNAFWFSQSESVVNLKWTRLVSRIWILEND